MKLGADPLDFAENAEAKELSDLEFLLFFNTGVFSFRSLCILFGGVMANALLSRLSSVESNLKILLNRPINE